MQAAGIVIMKDRLDDVVNAILIARATFRRIKINFVWAFVYNIVLVPVAMGCLYPIGAKAPEKVLNGETGQMELVGGSKGL